MSRIEEALARAAREREAADTLPGAPGAQGKGGAGAAPEQPVAMPRGVEAAVARADDAHGGPAPQVSPPVTPAVTMGATMGATPSATPSVASGPLHRDTAPGVVQGTASGIARGNNGYRAVGAEGRAAYADSKPRQVTLDQKLIAASGFDDPMSEEYRKIKGRLVSLARQKGMNLFMVTSSVMGEGKTLVSANLAISLAQEYDNTVLYIDADLRAPCAHGLFGVEASPGLSDCLMDGIPLHEALVPTGVGRLSFLPAGRQLPNPGELFASSLMRDMLHEMKRRYADRYVIIDTAPALPFAETRVLGRMVDGVLLVARENIATLNGISKTLEALEGSNLMGVIYNDASHPAWPSFPGYGDRYGTNRYAYGAHRTGQGQ